MSYERVHTGWGTRRLGDFISGTREIAAYWDCAGWYACEWFDTKWFSRQTLIWHGAKSEPSPTDWWEWAWELCQHWLRLRSSCYITILDLPPATLTNNYSGPCTPLKLYISVCGSYRILTTLAKWLRSSVVSVLISLTAIVRVCPLFMVNVFFLPLPLCPACTTRTWWPCFCTSCLRRRGISLFSLLLFGLRRQLTSRWIQQTDQEISMLKCLRLSCNFTPSCLFILLDRCFRRYYTPPWLLVIFRDPQHNSWSYRWKQNRRRLSRDFGLSAEWCCFASLSGRMQGKNYWKLALRGSDVDICKIIWKQSPKQG